ncbi:hypothetical protein MMC09_004646 [Bachmanniomyces sp. S44760]|nr:hypothetical protein [Bachmanniomyces sp. S44760]
MEISRDEEQSPERQELEDEVSRLEKQLAIARATLNTRSTSESNNLSIVSPSINSALHFGDNDNAHALNQPSASLHALLLLSDSALPLGSFAFSSGLESYLAHEKQKAKAKPAPHPPPTATASLHHFLHLSISSLASTTLPYLIAAYHNPSSLPNLDNDLDACTLCPVARRASIAQGKALLSVWERALRPSNSTGPEANSSSSSSSSTTSTKAAHLATSALTSFSTALKSSSPSSSSSSTSPPLNAHFPPLYALVSTSLQIPLPQTAYTYLHTHARSILSAAVRASLLGPYAAQAVLASPWLKTQIQDALEKNWDVRVQDAGQGNVMIDLWVGRHEVLYSRIFNS